MTNDIHDLTDIERIAITGVHARNQAIQLQTQSMLADRDIVFRAIESRIGLKTGAIGTTHQIDLDRSIVQLIPDQE